MSSKSILFTRSILTYCSFDPEVYRNFCEDVTDKSKTLTSLPLLIQPIFLSTSENSDIY